MKKNIISKILFTFTCMLITVNYVFAVTSGTGSGSGSGSDTSISQGSFLTGTNYPNRSDAYSIGIRISFYKSDGTQLYSKDYVMPSIATSAKTQYGSGQPCAKIKYSAGLCSYTTWQDTNFASTAELTNLFTVSGYPDINIDNILSRSTLSKDELFYSILHSDNIDKAKDLFRKFDIDPANYYSSSNEAYDLFLVWEPLAKINYNGVGHIGTPHELATFVEGKTGTFCFNTCSPAGSTGYWAVGKAITVNSGCDVYLDDSDDFGNSVKAKFPTNFTSRSYFGGKLDATTAEGVTSGCNNNNANALKTYAVSNTNSALGIGILWFNDIGTGTDEIVGCSDINARYGTDTIRNSIDTNNYFDFSEFNNWVNNNAEKKFPSSALSGITTAWYRVNCPWSGNNPEGENCTPQYGVSNCSQANGLIYYNDSTNWEKCIFTDTNNGLTNKYDISPHKEANKNSNLTYYDSNLSSPYCEVYCRESVSASLDSSNPTVLAGSQFQWGWSEIQTTRTCRTKNIDIEQFKKDLKSANEDVVQQMAQNKLSEANAGGTWSATGRNNGSSGTCTQSGSSTPGTPPSYNDCPAGVKLTHIKCTPTGLGTHSCSYSYNIAPTCDYYKYSKSITSASVTVETVETGESITKSATVFNSVFEKCSGTQPSGNPVAVGDVGAAVNKVNSIIADYKKCYEFNNSQVLTDLSSAEISYKSANGTYDYKGNMKINRIPDYDDKTCPTTLKYQALTNCSGTSCTTTSANLYNCESHEEVGNSTSSFSLADDIYRYILKNPNGLTVKSIHAADLGNYTSGTLTVNWVDTGSSNFPIPYYANAQLYTGALKIEYSNLGHKSSQNTSTSVDQILKGVDPTNYGNWSCNYTVQPDLFPPKKDINLIYREIDLYNPFPDINAGNRNTGSNWCSGEYCAWNNPVSSAYILNNRNVQGDELYNLKPMYTFIMTPSDIIDIRKYNKENTYTSYTGIYGSEKYNFKCISGTGRGCRSEYLDKLMSMMDTKDYPGTCINDRTVPTNEQQFNSCRY